MPALVLVSGGARGGRGGGWTGNVFLSRLIVQLGLRCFFRRHDVGGSMLNFATKCMVQPPCKYLCRLIRGRGTRWWCKNWLAGWWGGVISIFLVLQIGTLYRPWPTRRYLMMKMWWCCGCIHSLASVFHKTSRLGRTSTTFTDSYVCCVDLSSLHENTKYNQIEIAPTTDSWRETVNWSSAIEIFRRRPDPARFLLYHHPCKDLGRSNYNDEQWWWTTSTNHKLGRTVCNFANFGRTNMIQVGIPLVSLFLIVSLLWIFLQVSFWWRCV
jgi:hypothetical protein